MALIKYQFTYRLSSNDVLIATNDGLWSTIVSPTIQLSIYKNNINIPISTTSFINLHYAEFDTINGQSIFALGLNNLTSLLQYLNDYCFNDSQPIAGGTISGVSGSGFIGFNSQSTSPVSPTNGFKIYANGSNALSWIGTNGYTQTFNTTNNTSNRVYTLPNGNGTFALLSGTQIWSGVNSFVGNVGFGTAIIPGELFHIGDGNMLLEGGGEVAQKFKRDFTTSGSRNGVQTGSGQSINPIFSVGRIIEAGDGDPELRFMYADDASYERTVFEVDRKGIVASVKTSIGSHFEGFKSLTDENPMFRLNSYPRMRLEMGAGGANITDVAVERNSNGGLSLFTNSTEKVVINSDGSMSIGTNSTNSSAQFEINSVTKGILIPKMTTSQRNAITGVNGLQVYDTTLNRIYIHDGTKWDVLSSLSGSFSQTASATTTFMVNIGTTMSNTTYKVNITPTSALSASMFYVTNKTTTTFDVMYLMGLTGTVTFDFTIFK